MTIPAAIEQLLKRNQLLHLATCSNDIPSVSLMNFSYLSPQGSTPPTIIVSSPRDTTKIENIKANPNVSILIHDWVNDSSQESGTDLRQYLQRLNQAQLGQTSVTLYGSAHIPAGEEAEYYRERHLESHPGAECFIKNADVVLVVPHKATVADSQNHVQTYTF